MNKNCAQESKLFDDRQSINFTSKGKMVFYNEPLENVTPHIFCMSFMMGSVEATLWDEYCKFFFANRLLLAHPL
jgi:hypothetical protein